MSLISDRVDPGPLLAVKQVICKKHLSAGGNKTCVNVEYEVTEVNDDNNMVTLDPHDLGIGAIVLNKETVEKIHNDGSATLSNLMSSPVTPFKAQAKTALSFFNSTTLA